MDQLAREICRVDGPDMVTAANPMSPDDAAVNDPNVVKVVASLNGDALYFSRSPVPYFRSGATELPVYRHKGIYAYTREFLERFVSWSPTPLETAECLEQLRALENGATIRIVSTNDDSPGVDTPEQANEVEKILTEI